MKNQQPDELDGLLGEWHVAETLPPRFEERVRRRIEHATVPTLSLSTVLKTWFEQTFARPAIAVAYVAVLIAVGTALGFKQAQDTSARIHDQLGARYVQALDPYQHPGF